MGKLKHYSPLPKKKLLQLYYDVLLRSHLTYALPAWGFTYKCNRQRLTILLNRAVRIISSAKNFDSLNPLHQKLNILKFN